MGIGFFNELRLSLMDKDKFQIKVDNYFRQFQYDTNDVENFENSLIKSDWDRLYKKYINISQSNYGSMQRIEAINFLNDAIDKLMFEGKQTYSESKQVINILNELFNMYEGVMNELEKHHKKAIEELTNVIKEQEIKLSTYENIVTLLCRST